MKILTIDLSGVAMSTILYVEDTEIYIYYGNSVVSLAHLDYTLQEIPYPQGRANQKHGAHDKLV